MDCELAREALSARIDGEREPVPSARVDEHVRSCARCGAWYANAQQHSLALQRLAGTIAPPTHTHPDAAHPRAGWVGRHGVRLALGLAGLVLIGVAAVQAAGWDFGMVAHGGVGAGSHLLNESTAWCAALGVAAVAAAVRPAIALGLAWVLSSYTAVLSYYVAVDALAGHVTPARMASHLPVAVAAALAVLVWRRHEPPPEQHPTQLSHTERTEPSAPSVRRHLRPTDDSAA